MPTHPSLVDSHHRIDELLGISNVPMAVWIDETGTLVRPAEGTDARDRPGVSSSNRRLGEPRRRQRLRAVSGRGDRCVATSLGRSQLRCSQEVQDTYGTSWSDEFLAAGGANYTVLPNL